MAFCTSPIRMRTCLAKGLNPPSPLKELRWFVFIPAECHITQFAWTKSLRILLDLSRRSSVVRVIAVLD